MFHATITAPAKAKQTTHVFKTRDGADLVGELFLPAARRPFALVIINGATGVPQRYYKHFARWLAEERGLACLTYDYRDIGRSTDGPLRRSTTTMAHWGIEDAEAARRFARIVLPDIPIWLIGHSLGGMMLPFQRDFGGVRRIINVGSGAVHHLDHPWPYRDQAMAFRIVLGPIGTAIRGFQPARAIGVGENLPRRAFWQWRRWCTSKGFYQADIGKTLPEFEPNAITAPIRFLSVSDDDLCPRNSTAKLFTLYGQGEIVDIEAGHDQIGHTGLFARANAHRWPEIIQA